MSEKKKESIILGVIRRTLEGRLIDITNNLNNIGVPVERYDEYVTEHKSICEMLRTLASERPDTPLFRAIYEAVKLEREGFLEIQINNEYFRL